jgi:hypothetical protein
VRRGFHAAFLHNIKAYGKKSQPFQQEIDFPQALQQLAVLLPQSALSSLLHIYPRPVSF